MKKIYKSKKNILIPLKRTILLRNIALSIKGAVMDNIQPNLFLQSDLKYETVETFINCGLVVSGKESYFISRCSKLPLSSREESNTFFDASFMSKRTFSYWKENDF